MPEKIWVNAIGTPGENPRDTDQLLNDTLSKKKKKDVERQMELDEKEHKTKLAELDKKEKTAMAEGEKAEQKATGQPEGFQLTGGVNLGTIDFQAQQQRLEDELKRMKEEADASAGHLSEQNEQLRREIHSKELELITTTLTAQMQASDRRVEQLIQQNASRGSIVEELQRQKDLAKELGYIKPEGTGDIMAQIELKKLDFDQTLRLREFDEENKKRDRDWEIEKVRLQDERDGRKREDQRDKDRMDTLAGGLARIGDAGAKAVMDRHATGGGGGQVSQKRSTYTAEALIGEEGETSCPNSECDGVIYIAPTARNAECAKCHAVLSIKRIKEQPAPVAEEGK